jgi:hypothetical protein
MRGVDARWLRARRDAWVDRALAYTVLPLLFLAVFAAATLPLAALTGLGGLGIGLLWADIKKTQMRWNRLINEILIHRFAVIS